jgi:HD-like signal output (HDOD) protein
MSSTEAMHRALTGVVSRGDFVVPPYPAVALRLQRLLAKDTYGIGDVADIIAADAALATSVLAVANSALVGGAAPITSLSRAVNRLGARTVGAIAVASGIGAASLNTGVLLEVRFRVWRRGMTCALACQKLAKHFWPGCCTASVAPSPSRRSSSCSRPISRRGRSRCKSG